MLSKSISAINKIWMFGSSQLDKLKKKANITKAATTGMLQKNLL